MKKKIMVFMLLFVFLVGVVAPDQAKAEVSQANSFEELCADMNLPSVTSLPTEIDGIPCKYEYILLDVSNTWRVFAFAYTGDLFVRCNGFDTFDGSKVSYYIGFVSLGTWSDNSSGSNLETKTYNSFSLQNAVENHGYEIIFSTVDIYTDNSYSEVYFSKTTVDSYSFEQWCTDVGLTYAASSNETEDLYDFPFNPDKYHYIVRKNRVSGSEYTWYLTQVSLDDALFYYLTKRALSDNYIGAVHLGLSEDEFLSASIKMYNYVYDESGSGWLFTGANYSDVDYVNNYVDNIGITFSSSMPIVYSSTDIYSDKVQSSVYYAASTEYEDSEEIYPDISPTSTPTPTPISGSGSTENVVGGNAKPGGMLEFLVTLITLVWTDLFAVEVPVDGYMISFQQIVIYGAIVGMLIWGGCKLFGKKG